MAIETTGEQRLVKPDEPITMHCGCVIVHTAEGIEHFVNPDCTVKDPILKEPHPGYNYRPWEERGKQ
jgi:hypothetical protein